MNDIQYNLHLKGFVGGADFDSNYVDYVLSNNKGKPVYVLIDSLGGSLAKALSIASAFKAHGDVTAHFVGMNASAATIASLGAKHITMDSSAMYLVHKCSTEFFEWGNLNADQLETVRQECDSAIRDLNKLDNNVASMYAGKCSKKQEELLELMRKGGWLTAKEALDWGFVDEVTDFNEPKPVLTDAVASAMAAAGMPVPDMCAENRESLLTRFMAALASIFRPERETQRQERVINDVNNEPKIEKPMNYTLRLLGKVLGMEDFAASEDGMTLTLEQMKTLENAIAERDSRNAELTQELEALRKAPAEPSSAVIDDGGNNQREPRNEVESYLGTRQSASQLFDMVP